MKNNYYILMLISFILLHSCDNNNNNKNNNNGNFYSYYNKYFKNDTNKINANKYLKEGYNILSKNPKNINDPLKYYDLAIQSDSFCSDAYLAKLLILRNNEKYNEAIKLLYIFFRKGIISINDTYWTLGMFYEKIGKMDSAITYYKKSLSCLGPESDFGSFELNCFDKLQRAISYKLLFDSTLIIDPECAKKDPYLIEKLKLSKKEFLDYFFAPKNYLFYPYPKHELDYLY